MVASSRVDRESGPEEEEPVQAQREAGAGEHRRMSGGSAGVLPPGFGDRLAAGAGRGDAIEPGTRGFMESAFNADFSGVSIHTGPEAAQMSNSIGARAFTHGNDIYFNEGEYGPETEEGKHLLAHELTHTLQQGGAGAGDEGARTVQRSLFSRGWNALKRAGEWVGDSLEAGKDWLLGKLKGMLSDIPGYRLFTVVLGQDPVTRETVNRNGMNFIEAGLDIIPSGEEYKQKLREEGALEEAAAWLDEQIEMLDISPSSIVQQVRDLWNSLSLSDVRSPGGVFDRLYAIFSGPVSRIVRFARNVATKFLEIVKNYLLSKLREFVAERESSSFYPLLTVVLGHDPITGEDVDRSGENILRGFISLHPEGDEQLRQMQETGSFQRASEWIDTAIIRVRNIAAGLRTAFLNAWDAVTDISSLMDPVGTFTRIYQDFRTPLVELADFAIEVASTILNFIKDALLRRLSNWARDTRGYPLITVLLGRDPFTEEPVPRTPENIIRGFMALLPNGMETFNRLQESGAIARMVSWIEGAVASLNITWGYIVGLFMSLWERFSLSSLANPIQAFQQIIDTFAEPIRRILSFIFEVIKAVVMFVLEIMNFPFDIIRSIVDNAMQAYEDIRRDPIEFFLNLLRAVKQGFTQFFDKIGEHLLGGLRNWLFGELSSAGINPPADLSFRSILGFVMELLGITIDNVWERLAEKIGQDRVDRIRGAIDRLSGIWNFVRDVYERGPVAIWEYIQERLSNLWDMIIEQIRNWIMTRIIQRVTARLLSMLDPTGIMAVVNSFITFYRAVQSFIERLREMLEIVNTFVAGVANIARGSLSQAAGYLENALAQGIPVAIGFLANQVGLRGLGRRIAEMVESIRERINAAIDWLIERALAAGSALMDMGRSAAGAVMDWFGLRKSFTLDNNESHEIYFQEESPEGPVVVASENPQELSSIISSGEWNGTAIPDDKLAQLQQKAREIDARRDNQGVAVGREIQERMDNIANILSNIAGQPLPETRVVKDDTVGSGMAEMGQHLIVKPLSLNPGNLAGSQPTIVTDLGRDLKSMYPGYFVEGHLLNHRMHGPGNERWNLTPISQKTNQAMERKTESTAKDKMLSEGKVLSYEAEVNYLNSLDKNAPTYPHEQIAGSIYMKVEELTWQNGSWEPADTQPSWAGEASGRISHDTSTVPGFGTGSLSNEVHLNSDSKRLLQRIPGIGPERADAIVEYRKNNPFGSKLDVQHVPGIGRELAQRINEDSNVFL